jgi:hypothetical protein
VLLFSAEERAGKESVAMSLWFPLLEKAPQKRALIVADLRRIEMAAGNEIELPVGGGVVYVIGLIIAIVGGMCS